jgi:leucyl-tRNA synthetase
MEYIPSTIEKKWQDWWKNHEVYQISNQSHKPKFYVLDMFPYPSGAGLHVGHPLGYIASDIYSRFKTLEGYNVLHPMGFDAFGLPAEQYAIQTGVHPNHSTNENINTYRKQLELIGFNYDWNREIKTSDPQYYKWTQWIFLQLYGHYYDLKEEKALPIDRLIESFETSGSLEVSAACSEVMKFSKEDWQHYSLPKKEEVLMNYRLAYRKLSSVNWCEELGTVLANDEVKDGVSERGGFPVIQKPMLQWSLRTTAYAQRLLEGLETLDWTEALKTQQKNWIGKSEGAQILFRLAHSSAESIEIFTTRPDTIYGATFLVLAPEHPLLDSIAMATNRLNQIHEYRNLLKNKNPSDAQASPKTPTGVFTGAYALHPFTGQNLPIWTSEYVLAGYGTGAIMAVPANDERDQLFAKHFALPILEVIDQSEFPHASIEDKVGFVKNSERLEGLSVKEAIEKAIQIIEQEKLGKRKTQYKLRDANFSRQRYWGEPFPISYDDQGMGHSDKIQDLPIVLPDLDDFLPASDGKSPLSKVDHWVNKPNGHHRETDTMPGFAGSSWYFLRFMDPHNERELVSKEAIQYWQNVDVYIGGAEHAVGHLLYARTWHKFLFDIGVVPTEEPFKKLINQGMIQGISEKIYVSKGTLHTFWTFDEENQPEEKQLKSPKKIVLSKKHLPFYQEKLGEDAFSTLHVPVSLVSNYGLLDQGYLTLDQYKLFLKERPSLSTYFAVGDTGHCSEEAATPYFKISTFSEVEKMSKSKFNVINPDEVIQQYGADCFRLYEMFLGPLEQAKPWDTKGIDGVYKFLKRFSSLFTLENTSRSEGQPTPEELVVLHTCIKKVREDVEKFSFNTCVSAFMICVNDLKKLSVIHRDILKELCVLIAPFAPHLAEELWQVQLNQTGTVFDGSMPVPVEAYLFKDTIVYPIAINGKKRSELELPSNMPPKEVEKTVLSSAQLEKWLEGKAIQKVIVVPKRMVNIVVG